MIQYRLNTPSTKHPSALAMRYLPTLLAFASFILVCHASRDVPSSATHLEEVAFKLAALRAMNSETLPKQVVQPAADVQWPSGRPYYLRADRKLSNYLKAFLPSWSAFLMMAAATDTIKRRRSKQRRRGCGRGVPAGKNSDVQERCLNITRMWW